MGGEAREVIVSEPAKDVIFLGLDLNVDEEVVSLTHPPLVHATTSSQMQLQRGH